MAIKIFQPALEDCQQAVTLQAASPSLKTLIRLARCQLVIDSPASVLSTLSSALSFDPSNEAALQLRKEALELDADLNAEKMKDEGNRAFEAKKFDDAIWFYTKAIRKCHRLQILTRTIETPHRNTARPGVPRESCSILHGDQEIPPSFR